MKKNLILALLLMLSGLLASLTSYNASALSITQDVQFSQTWTNAVMKCAVRYGSLVTTNGNTCVFGTNTGNNLQGRGLAFISTSDVNLVQGDYYQFYLDVSVSDGAEHAIPVMWNLNTTGNFTIVDFNQVSTNENMGTTSDTESYVTTYSIILRSSVNNSSYPIELGYSDYSKNMLYYAGDFWTSPIDVRITRINRYHPDNTSLTVSDIVTAINQSNVNSGIQSLNNTGLGIRSDLQDLQSTLDDINDNEGRVADVAEDEYNQTQEDRENASSDANGFSFNFSLPNPFSLFQVSDGCVNTPVIDSWLHLEGDWQSPHCPVFPVNVRSALTPILSLLISLACLMVVIRWVSSSSADVVNGISASIATEKGGKK